MSLNIGGVGNGKPYCKYSAKSDKWFVRGADGQDKEIERPTFVVDLANIATGWLRIREGQPPERMMDPSLQHAAPSPGDGFRRGFVVLVYSPKFLGGVAEISSTSIHMSNAIKEVYDQYEADNSNNPGKLPVVACTGSQPMKDRHGTNYRPTLTITRWVDRPTELPNANAVSADEIYKGNINSTGSTNGSGQPSPPPEPRRTPEPLDDPLF